MGKTSRNLFLLLGVTAGAALTYFATTTRKGKETKEKLVSKVDDVKDRIVSNVRKNVSRISEGENLFL